MIKLITRLFLVATTVLFSSCLGDDYTTSNTTTGAAIYASVISTNAMTNDLVDIALRLSLLINEADSFEQIETLYVTLDDGRTRMARELLFGSSENCTIVKTDTTYVINYSSDYALSGDLQRSGSFIITHNSYDSLFDSEAEWMVRPGTGTTENNMIPQVTQSGITVYYGDNSYAEVINRALGEFYAESYSEAKKVSAGTDSYAADWSSEMTIIFPSADYSMTQTSDNIKFSYSSKGRLIDNYNSGYDYEQQAKSLIYSPACSTTFLDGTIVTTNWAYYYNMSDSNLATSTLVRTRSSATSCNYSTEITYNGYTESW